MKAFLKRFVRWTLTLLVVAGGVGALLVWQGLLPIAKGRAHGDEPAAAKSAETKKAASRRGPETAVTVAPVTGRPVQRRVQVVGTLHGTEEIDVASKVNGRVLRILHDVGDLVQPGEILLEVDPTDLRLAVTEATRSLELEMARLGLNAVPARDFDVATLPGVARAKLLEKNARNKYERSQSLLKQQAISREDVEQTETDWEVAQSNTRQAVLDAEATVAAIRQREALLETARQKLRDAKIVVPSPSLDRSTTQRRVVQAAAVARRTAASEVEYVVASRMISEGEMVHDAPNSTTVFRLVIDRPLKLKANVPERHAGEIRVGQAVELTVEAWPGEQFSGSVTRVNPTVDRENRTFSVEVALPNEDRRLRAGSFSKAAILTREEADVPTIPEEAFVKFAGIVKVFVVREGQVQSVKVEPGLRIPVEEDGRTQTWQEVAGALEPGDEVVTSGHSQLAEGSPVRVRDSSKRSRTE